MTNPSHLNNRNEAQNENSEKPVEKRDFELLTNAHRLALIGALLTGGVLGLQDCMGDTNNDENVASLPSDTEVGTKDSVAPIVLPTEKPSSVAERLGIKNNKPTAVAILNGKIEQKWLDEVEKVFKVNPTLNFPLPELTEEDLKTISPTYYQVEGATVTGSYGAGGRGRGAFGSRCKTKVPDGEDLGYHRALDIQAPKGTDILAVADGMVLYSGSHLHGFATTVMVLHPGGYVSMYSHNDKNTSVAGQFVRAGEKIAEVGKSGVKHSGTHVHFEFKYASTDGSRGVNCDPEPFFRLPEDTTILYPLEAEPKELTGGKPDAVCAPWTTMPKTVECRSEKWGNDGKKEVKRASKRVLRFFGRRLIR